MTVDSSGRSLDALFDHYTGFLTFGPSSSLDDLFYASHVVSSPLRWPTGTAMYITLPIARSHGVRPGLRLSPSGTSQRLKPALISHRRVSEESSMTSQSALAFDRIVRREAAE